MVNHIRSLEHTILNFRNILIKANKLVLQIECFTTFNIIILLFDLRLGSEINGG